MRLTERPSVKIVYVSGALRTWWGREALYFFLRFHLFILERGEGREKERERNSNV